jgi:myo-inositol-1-phosphate synthase
MDKEIEIKPASGKLGILTPGMGAVTTTFVAGVYAVQQGHGKSIGSLTQTGTIRLGKRTDKRVPLIKDFVSLSGLDDLVFGGWDIFEDDKYAAAVNAGVLERATLNGIKTELENVKPMPAVFDQNYVKRLSGTHVKKGKTKMDLAARAGMSGIQEWLSFYYKSPMVAEGLYPEHDMFIQLKKLKNTLRYLKGEDLITHLGREYYG